MSIWMDVIYIHWPAIDVKQTGEALETIGKLGAHGLLIDVA